MNRFAPYVALSALLLLEVLFHAVRHEPTADLERTLASGTPEERVWALYRLANRDGVPPLDREDARQLLSSPDALVRELMFTPNLRRFGDARQRDTALAELAVEDEEAWARSEFLHVYGGRKSSSTTSTHWITLEVLERFLELDGGR